MVQKCGEITPDSFIQNALDAFGSIAYRSSAEEVYENKYHLVEALVEILSWDESRLLSSSHPQLIRLLLWSIGEDEHELLRMLMDSENCEEIIESGEPVHAHLSNCDECTPMIVAMTLGAYEIVELLIRHHASTAGLPCGATERANFGLRNVVLIAVKNRMFNPLLESLLDLCLEHPQHWVQQGFQPLHVAAAFKF